jgi:hypothetical protein
MMIDFYRLESQLMLEAQYGDIREYLDRRYPGIDPWTIVRFLIDPFKRMVSENPNKSVGVSGCGLILQYDVNTDRIILCLSGI